MNVILALVSASAQVLTSPASGTTARISYPPRTDGTRWCWGNNSSGGLGDGTTTDKSSPVQVGSPKEWVSVAAGGSHTCGVRTDGTLWCWGDNSYGEVSSGAVTDVLQPLPALG
jgi:hypothetical protein